MEIQAISLFYYECNRYCDLRLCNFVNYCNELSRTWPYRYVPVSYSFLTPDAIYISGPVLSYGLH
jgi:hypothetical protein